MMVHLSAYSGQSCPLDEERLFDQHAQCLTTVHFVCDVLRAALSKFIESAII